MTSTQGIKLDPATRERLKELGKLKQRTPHWLMRIAIEQFLEKEERFEQEKQEDFDRWQRYQLSGIQRMPNLTAWAARLHDSTQIVILDVGQMPQLDANAATEIHSLVIRLTGDRRELVLAGIGRDQYRALNESPDTKSLIDIDNLCPDLDMAIARSLNLISQRTEPPAA